MGANEPARQAVFNDTTLGHSPDPRTALSYFRPIVSSPVSPGFVSLSFLSSEKLSIGIRFLSSEKASPSGSRGLKTRNLKRFSLLRHFGDLTKCAYNC